MDDVDDVSTGGSVLFEKRGDDFAGLGDVGYFEFTVCVFVLSVDDDEGAVGGGCLGGLDTKEVSEGGGRHCGEVYVCVDLCVYVYVDLCV